MSAIPSHMLAARRELARRYLKGSGIELGALHQPLDVPAEAKVSYVDRCTEKELRGYYPELAEHSLVPVHVIDDGETLQSFPPETVDFIIGNHFLEHCENPLGTLRRHLHILRRYGLGYYAIPDRRYGFDNARVLTPFEHLLRDDREGPEWSRRQHYDEWVRLVVKERDPAVADQKSRQLMERRYSIHFHVWDAQHFFGFLAAAIETLEGAFYVEHFERNDTEIITVIRKT